MFVPTTASEPEPEPESEPESELGLELVPDELDGAPEEETLAISKPPAAPGTCRRW